MLFPFSTWLEPDKPVYPNDGSEPMLMSPCAILPLYQYDMLKSLRVPLALVAA